MGIESMWDGAPTDFNVRGGFPIESLDKVLIAASSIMTIRCQPKTHELTILDTEKYELSHVLDGRSDRILRD